MITESLARKFRPAGFDQPEGSRRAYTKPPASRQLKYAFDRWLDQSDHVRDGETEYKEACKLIRHLGQIPYGETNALLFDFDPQTQREMDVGFFISACYNRSPEKVIIFDVDAPDVDCIGYRLGKNKVLVNNGKVRFVFGWEASGIVVNNGLAEAEACTDSSCVSVNNGQYTHLFGADSSGIIVNNGEATYRFGEGCSGIAISLKEIKSYGNPGKNGKILKPEDIARIPDLKNYLEELSGFTKAIRDDESARKFLERYGNKPGERIETYIKRILMEGGYKV